VETGTAPLADRFRPEQALSGFNRKQIHGKWTLVISDGDGGDSGTLFLREAAHQVQEDRLRTRRTSFKAGSTTGPASRCRCSEGIRAPTQNQ
jgi:hypothetical protein